MKKDELEETLGMLEANTIVVLTAKNATASWFQIEYPSGSEARGWVTAQYIQTDYSAELPVVDEFGQPVSTGTPGATPVPMTPTPTLGPAAEDGDSSEDPAVSIVFSSGGTRKFTYSSQVSTPEGDAEDWVEFTPFDSLPAADARLLVTLVCTGNGTLDVELWQSGASLPAWGTLECGDSDRVLALPAGDARRGHADRRRQPVPAAPALPDGGLRGDGLLGTGPGARRLPVVRGR